MPTMAMGSYEAGVSSWGGLFDPCEETPLRWGRWPFVALPLTIGMSGFAMVKRLLEGCLGSILSALSHRFDSLENKNPHD